MRKSISLASGASSQYDSFGTRLSAIVRDQTAGPGERVALALAVSEMQNVSPLGLEQPAVSFHKRSELRVLPSNGRP